MRINEILPDRIEAQQWRSLCERLLAALIQRNDADKQLIAEARARLEPPPTHPCDEWREEWNWDHG